MMSNTAKSFDFLSINLSILCNYLDGLIKLFLELYLTKFLDIHNRSFCIMCIIIIIIIIIITICNITNYYDLKCS